MSSTLAIDIGGTKTSISAVEGDWVADVKTWSTGPSAAEVLLQIETETQSLIEAQTFVACGIGFGGQFDFARQQVIRSVHVPGWDGVELSAWASAVFGIPAIADNDANVGGLGEARLGAGREFSSVVYLTISTGIGGAIMLDGIVQRGSHSLAGEFGHVTLDPDGPVCGCGLRGCAERMLSGLWLQRDHGESAEVLFQDEGFLEGYTEGLSALLQQITMVLDPEVFVLGGGIGASSDQLAQAAQAALEERLRSWERSTPQVRRAAFAGNSVLVGAGLLAKDHYGAPG